MRTLLYQWRFVQPIRKKIKFSTIRKEARCERGDRLVHRVSLPGRDPDDCPLILESWCTGVYPVTIDAGRVIIGQSLASNPDQIARQEGFRNWPDLLQWFSEFLSLPYAGVMIEWSSRKPFAGVCASAR